jgi:NADH dehydrogenase FAD-containing subunit
MPDRDEHPPVVGRRVVLVGAGHAHLHLLKRAAEFPRRGLHLTVIAPEDFWYSGVATGVLGGRYPAEYERIDIAGLLADSGAALLRARLSGLDAASRHVLLADGGAVPYDVVSLNLGSTPPELAGAHPLCFDVKPVANLHRLAAALDAWHRERPGEAARIAVVGGGMSGVEIAANLEQLARRTGAAFGVSLYAAGGVLDELPRAASGGVSRALRRRGVTIFTQSRVTTLEAGGIVLGDGRTEPADFVVNASGLRPAPVCRALGLPVDSDGGIIVDATLASAGSPSVFAAGDCIAFCGTALPRVGVYAIRQAPILFENLIATLEGRPLTAFEPQRRFLTIANLGDDTGLAVRGAFHWQGWLAWLLKDRIDAAFLAEYRSLPAPGSLGQQVAPTGRSEP